MDNEEIECELTSSTAGQDPVADCCDHGNGPYIEFHKRRGTSCVSKRLSASQK